MILASQNNILAKVFGQEGAIDIMSEAGYDAIDLSLFSMTDDNYEFCRDGYRTRAMEIAAYAKSKGIYFSQSHTPFLFNWKNPNEVEDKLFPRTVQALEISALSGC